MTLLRRIFPILFASIIVLGSCQNTDRGEPTTMRPNIVWLVTEDMGHYLPAFGDSTIKTPNISRLAAEGVRYPNFFSPSGVCAPSRAAIATGLYPSSFGANHMRTGSHTDHTGLPKYEAIPPPETRMMSEWLRMEGYYCSNNVKEDYQFRAPVTAWDESSYYAHFRNRKDGQPFFAIFNFTTTHESGLFEPYGIRKNELRHYHSGDTSISQQTWNGKTGPEETPVLVDSTIHFNVPPYLPDNEVTQRDMWKLYNNIAEMDRQLGAILDQLEEDGLLDNTIIFFYADHGGPLPRQKRLIYDSGLKSPMIVWFPDKRGAGSIDEQLVSFIDLAPTVLSLADIAPKDYMHGQTFLGSHKTADERSYIHGAADRFDEFTDAIRAVRGPQYKYIRNYRPEQPYYLPVSYREQIPTMKELLRLRDAGQLNEYQMQWFRETKDPEELFDCINDPHELNNLAGDPAYANKLNAMRTEMDRWLTQVGDQPNLPERELIDQLWDGKDQQPVTMEPTFEVNGDQLTITCGTKGASIGYQVVSESGQQPESWQVYSKPITIPQQGKVLIQAHRIGYQPSKTLTYTVN
ncbi:MAG: sulfatase [Cyclobacteriaceae bacterium]|nr:sulfatase [Cyclobacteriaceae bacterium SS2]